MIICIVENSTQWDDFGQPYLIDTSLLKNKKLINVLENSKIVGETLIPSVELIGLATSEGWLNEVQYYLDEASVIPPQTVNIIVKVVFN